MPENPSLMVPVSDSDVGQLALIQAIRMSSEQISRLATSVEKVSDQVTDMSKDVAVLKSHDTKHEIALIRQAVATAMAAVDAKIEAAEAQWRSAEAVATATRERLLAESVADRKALWIAIENIKGRLVPLVAAGTLICAAVAAFVMERVLK